MLKALSATQKQVDLVKLHEQAKRNLEEEIQNYKDEAQKQRKIIFQLEKERDRYINEASDLTQKVGPSTDCAGWFIRMLAYGLPADVGLALELIRAKLWIRQYFCSPLSHFCPFPLFPWRLSLSCLPAMQQPRLARILFPVPSFLNSVLSLHLFLTLSSPQKTEAEHARRKTPN